MTALYILLGVIAALVLILSIRLSVFIEYDEVVNLNIQWLFIKKSFLPLTAKQKKKAEETAQKAEDTAAITEEKTEDAAAVTAEKTQEQVEQPADAPKKKKEPKPSLIKLLWENHGYDGLVKMLKDALNALNTFLGKILFSVVIKEMEFTMRVSKGDAAATAIEYGKVCAELYPLFGDIVSKFKVHSYDINIFPDYLVGKSAMHLYAKLTVSPRKVLNCTLGLLFRLLFKVVLKLLYTLLFKKPKSNPKNKTVPITSKGGAS